MNRYDLLPQLEDYRRLGQIFFPYITRISTPRFSSGAVNTDCHGFRHSYDTVGCVDSDTWRKRRRRALLMGSSYAFGVGASGDAKTLASVLSHLTGYSFLNAGIRAANSLQELIAAIPFVQDADYILVVSGMNNLIFSLQSLGIYDLYCPLVGEEVYREISAYDLMELSSWKFFLSRFYRRLWKFRGAREMPCSDSGGSHKEALQNALAYLRRDLIILKGAMLPSGKIFFAIQPFADVLKRELVPQEKQLFDLHRKEKRIGEWWRYLNEELKQLWPAYAAGIQKICRDLQIDFADLNEMPFEGWCYVDPVHMTDNGYQQVAHFLAQRIKDETA